NLFSRSPCSLTAIRVKRAQTTSGHLGLAFRPAAAPVHTRAVLAHGDHARTLGLLRPNELARSGTSCKQLRNSSRLTYIADDMYGKGADIGGCELSDHIC